MGERSRDRYGTVDFPIEMTVAKIDDDLMMVVNAVKAAFYTMNHQHYPATARSTG